MANFSFTAQGATPQKPSVFGAVGGSTTPVSKALSNTQGIASFGNPTGKSYVAGGQFPTQSAQMNSGLLSQSPVTAPPQTAIKAQTQTDAAGNTTKTEYHPPQNTGNSSGMLPQSQSSQDNAAAPPQSTPPTFQGLLGTVAQQGSQQSPVTQQASQAAQSAATEYNRLNQQIGQTRLSEADALAHQGLAPIPMGDITGRQAVIRNQYEQRLAGLGAQAQGATALYGPSIGAAATGQGQQFGAAQSALGAAQPQLAPTGQQAYYNPVTQQQAPGGNTPFTGGQVQGDVALGQQYAQNVSANNQAKAIKSSVQTYLAQNPTLNPSAFPDFNSALQFLNGKVSNPQYQILSNQLQEYINTLAPILGVGGDTTNLKTQIANGFINAKASGQSISQVLDGIEQLANAKLVAQQGGSGSTGGATGQQSTGGLFSW